MQLGNAIRRFERGYFATCERSQKTREAYTCDLRQFCAFAGRRRRLDLLGPEVIEQWAGHLRSAAFAPASVRRKLASLRVFFLYWTRREKIKSSPFWRLQLSLGRHEQLPRCLTRKEVKKLLSQALQAFVSSGSDEIPNTGLGFQELRNLALVDLLFATGLRVGELVSLDVDAFSNEELAYRVKGKGGRMRLAFLTQSDSTRIQRRYFGARAGIETPTSALFRRRRVATVCLSM